MSPKPRQSEGASLARHQPLLLRPAPLLASTFVVLILAGTVVLRLPVCHGEAPVGWLDALFVATSAVCVTGLSTVEGGAASFSRVGQVAILVLIQLGALGIMSFGTLGAYLLRRRISFSAQAAVQDVLFQAQHVGNFRRLLLKVLVLVVVLEVAGMLVIYPDIVAEGGNWFDAVFMAVSAFCNAGFSVYADSIEGFGHRPLFLFAMMVLIVLGGLGYTVLLELGQRLVGLVRRAERRTVKLSLNARIVLWFSLWLTVGGAVLLLALGLLGEGGLPEGVRGGSGFWVWRSTHALFQSVTARTAGFNTVPIAELPIASLLVLIPLMFIGGSPSSTAGGIKTTTLAVWAGRISARLRGQEEVVIWERRIPAQILRRAGMVVAVAALWNAVGVFILAAVELDANPALRFEALIFEQVSAFGTVGLTTGLTTELSVVGKIWIILSMFVGRLGPLTVALVVIDVHRLPLRYPEERVIIG
jgi:trk system potassium uptake protein